MNIWLNHTTLWLMGNTPKLYPTIVPQLSMILDEFAFEKNFHCLLDNNYTDTTCNKGKTEQRRLEYIRESV